MAWARHGRTDRIASALRRGIHPDTKGRDGTTMMHVAAQNGRTDIVGLLLEHHADVNVTTAKGRDPMYFASRFQYAGRVIVQLITD